MKKRPRGSQGGSPLFGCIPRASRSHHCARVCVCDFLYVLTHQTDRSVEWRRLMCGLQCYPCEPRTLRASHPAEHVASIQLRRTRKLKSMLPSVTHTPMAGGASASPACLHRGGGGSVFGNPSPYQPRGIGKATTRFWQRDGKAGDPLEIEFAGGVRTTRESQGTHQPDRYALKAPPALHRGSKRARARA